MTTGSRKQATGLLTRSGMTKFWSGLRETRRNGQALFPGKGRRFKSGQPHHKKPILTTIKMRNGKNYAVSEA
jgi:hypothetical protein